LLGWIRRRFGPQDAEDLAQETFIQLVGNPTAIRNPKSFLMRLARDAAGMQARRRLARPTLVSEDLMPSGLCEPSDQEEALFLEQAILALPPKLREVFVLSRFGGLTTAETPGSAAGEGFPPALASHLTCAAKLASPPSRTALRNSHG
jgi:RNA polymerase sigma-70 factor (ECF subfamily)